MKTKLLLFLALVSAVQAGTSVGDQIVMPPSRTAGATNLIGLTTLSQPGTYAAASWTVVGQLRFAAPGDYTLEATTGGINIVGQLLSTVGPVRLHVKYAGGFNFVAGSIGSNVAVIDESSPAGELPVWLRTFTVAVGEHFVYSPPLGNPAACQWRRNGVTIPGATQPTLTLPAIQPADAGFYTVEVTENGRTHTIVAGLVAIRSSAKVVGDAVEVNADVVHPNGRRYDQILLTGAAATVTADPGQVTRISFIDLTNDIVQVELSGAGSLTIVLNDATGPDLPVNYRQSVRYMKGHATLLLADADATTNVSVFSVGRSNAVNQAMFLDGVAYDGIADIAALGVVSRTGQAGGLFLGNAHFFTAVGVAGVLAPGVEWSAVVRVGNVSAFDQALPVLVFGRADEVQITGGDLRQDNAQAVRVQGIGRVSLAAGTKSDGTLLSAQPIQGRLISGGIDVTGILITP